VAATEGVFRSRLLFQGERIPFRFSLATTAYLGESLSGNWMMLFMSMGRDYVSELRPPNGLLFIPQWYMSMQSHS
jgi:hypothetical protein